MSRITDTERGARMAHELAQERIRQPDLFPTAIPPSYWQAIVGAAYDELQDCKALREASRHG